MHRLLWTVVAMLALLWVVPAQAQPEGEAGDKSEEAKPSDDIETRKNEAKERFLRGLEFVRAENWDAALAEFLASREVYPTSVALKNAAISLRQLKRYAEALQMYEDLLREFGDKMKPEDKKAAQDAMAALRGSVGEIDVESNQHDSTVVIDGQQAGTTPLPAPIMVNAGTHSVRVSKEGYESYETQVLVAGKQRKLVKANLKGLSKTGTLVVREADGRNLDVVVDGAVVGQTPWQGTVAVGTHTVFLTGKDEMGTPPSSATVFHNQTSTLALRATKLDAEIRVEPRPSNARVDVDGVTVGNGVWEGRLKSGSHKVEVSAEGHVAYRKDVTVKTGQREVIRVALERDLSDPMWQAGFVPHIYAELFGGALWAPSLGGSADAACNRGECLERSRPFGLMAGVRGGYQLTSGLGIELFLGYMYAAESMTREVDGDGEDTTYTSTNYLDETTLSGPMAGLSASYMFDFIDKDIPLVLRVWAGAARVRASFSNGGTFTGSKPEYAPTLDPEPDPPCPDGPAPCGPIDVSADLRVPEKTQNLWMPFVGPEARIGYRLSKKLSVDVGVAVLLMFPPETQRVGRNPLSGDSDRKVAFPEFPDELGNNVRPGVMTLEQENGFGTHFAVVPNVAGRFDF